MKRSNYTCGCCGRQLPEERWVFSTHTRARYCWPGECKTDRRFKRRARRGQELAT